MAHVLLIEPNIVLAKTYHAALVHAGHTVAHVANAQAAIDSADVVTPDIVLLEVQLPVHNGIEFLQEFRSYSEWQQVPVLINTILPPGTLAVGEEALRRDFGIQTILYKPRTSLQDLVRLVREHTTPS